MDKKALQEQFEEFARWYVLPLDKSEDGIYRALETQSAWAACQHQQAKVEELQKRVELLEKHLELCVCGSKEISVDQEGYITKLCYRCGGIKTQEMIEQALKGDGCQ